MPPSDQRGPENRGPEQPDGPRREPFRWQMLPAVLVLLGALGVAAVAIVQRDALGPWLWALLAGAAVIAAAACAFWRRVSAEEQLFLSAQERVHTLLGEVKTERSQLQELRETIQEQARRQTDVMAAREQAFADKLATYQEWMEFPTPVDLRHSTPLGPTRRTPAARAGGPDPRSPRETAQEVFAGASESDEGLSDRELEELIAKDRELLELLGEETKILFEKIARNEYSRDGKVELGLIWTDMQTLTERVARIYIGQEVEHPLLETNLARILRAGSRAMLQLLVVLEELPLDVKEFNLSQVYSYVRKAVSAYGYYRSAEPFFPVFNSAYYLGRVALGANPVTMGTWWFMTQLGKRGARQLASRIVNRQALVFLQSIVKVIGFEVASIYGGDFRRRDPNWIYAAELTELVASFPLSQNSLSHALKEVGSLQLRSEYDRIFLYRCLAEHRSAQPQRYRAAGLLNSEERQAIVHRLEQFVQSFVDHPASDAIGDWIDGVESRLAIRIQSEGIQPTGDALEQTTAALRTLAGFLVDVKQIDPAQLVPWLAKCSSWQSLPAEKKSELQQHLETNPPFFLEQPDIDPENKVAERFLNDLCRLTVDVLPRSREIDDTATDLAAFLRQSPDDYRARLDQAYVERFERHLAPSSPVRKCPPELARAALNLIAEDDFHGFAYRGVRVEQVEGRSPNAPLRNGRNQWLIGFGDRLRLLSVREDPPRLLWEGGRDVRIEKVSGGLFSSDCRVAGGRWEGRPEVGDTILRIPSSPLRRYEDFYQPLKQFQLKIADPAADDD